MRKEGELKTATSSTPLISDQIEGAANAAMGHPRLTSTDVNWYKVVVRESIAVHLLVGAGILIIGMIVNDGRKYVKADLQALVPGCTTGYVDVWAKSSSDDGAYVCCNGEFENDGMCSSMVDSLPLENRLTKFPDSWIIPLFPLLLALLPPATGSAKFIGKRCLFYLAIMVFRVLVLYMLFGKIEDSIVGSGSECWYQPYMTRGTCYGREFDFSDHVVFFYVHLLLIPVVEVLCGIISFGSKDDDGVFSWISSLPNSTLASPLKVLNLSVRVLFAVYMEFLVTASVLRTAVYFHTTPETIVGYVISLMVQLPIFSMLWNFESTSLKNFLGIPGMDIEHEE